MTGTNFTEAELIIDTTPGKPVSGILVMPERIDTDGTGYYAERASTLYKDLLATGADVSYYTVKRKAIHRYSAGDYELITFLVGFFINGVGSAATYDVLKAYIISRFQKKPKSSVKGKIYIATQTAKSTTWQEYDIAGSMDDAIRMIDKIHEIHKDDNSSRDEKTEQ